MAAPKYRPVLTPDEIRYLNSILKRSYVDNLSKPPYSPDHPIDLNRAYDKVHEDYCLQLLNKFGALAAKIDNNATNPAYTSSGITPKDQLLVDLGEELPPATGHLSPGARRLAAYERYTANGPDACTGTELADAMEYRYLAGLMEPAEAEAYDAKQWENL